MDSSEVAFNAVTSSVKQLYLLLRSINFTNKAQVSITDGGLYFMAEDSRVMQGSVLIEKSLFSSYKFIPPRNEDDDASGEDDGNSVNFQINLPALLETLQVLGLTEAGLSQSASRENSGITAAMARGAPASALSSRILGTVAICRLTYSAEGAPLMVVLEENNLTTTCSLTTYEPESGFEGDIPLQRDRLTFKIILRASLLLGAIAELDSTSPSRLTISVSPRDPNLQLSAVGPHSSASVELSRDKQLLETFTCGGAITNSYRFSMIKAASRAMAMASKVSMRADENGVLSLQFMVEGDSPGTMSFIDFRYGALIDDEIDFEDV